MPAWVIPAIAGGAAVLGSLTGSKGRKAATDQFNAQMDTSIQRRVVDAKKAGIHPLFALGGSVGGPVGVFHDRR